MVELFIHAMRSGDSKITSELLSDIAIMFVLAGRDTTSDTLNWFFYCLSKNPRVEQRIRQELWENVPTLMDGSADAISLEQAQTLVFLEAAIKETMRLYPVSTISPREALRDAVLCDGTFVPKGMSMGISAYAMGRLTSVWGPDAAQYNPDRFLDKATGKLAPVAPFKFYGFGAGPRRCIGMHLAMLEMKMLVAAVFSRFRLEIAPNDGGYKFACGHANHRTAARGHGPRGAGACSHTTEFFNAFMTEERAFAARRLPRLAQVDALMRYTDPRLASLPHVADLVSASLDVSVRFTPAKAAAQDSTWLLGRVLERVLSDPAVGEAFRDHWLARAMEVAIRKNRLAAVQQIHTAHPTPLHVRSLQLALHHGTWEMILWVIEHRNDRLCSVPGLQNLCPQGLIAALPSAMTDREREAIVDGLASPHLLPHDLTIAQWLKENHRSLEIDGSSGARVCQVIAEGPLEAVDAIRHLLDLNLNISENELLVALVRGACRRELESAIDIVVASPLCDAIRDRFKWAPTRAGGAKVLQLDATLLAADRRVLGFTTLVHHFAFNATKFCHVETLQWLWHERGVKPTYVPYRQPATSADLLALYEWMADNNVEGSFGDDVACTISLSVVQWLHEHRPELLTAHTMDTAAARGNLEIVQWLHANRQEGCSEVALPRAAQNGQLQVVEWLSLHRAEGDSNDALVRAAARGHLDVVVSLHATRADACGTCALRFVLSCAMGDDYGHLSSPSLDTVRWLTANATRAPSCVGRCKPEHQQLGRFQWTVPALALAKGDLALAQFLWVHHRAQFQVEPVEGVVRGGHLPAIQWLYAEAREAVNWAMVLQSAREADKPEIVSWLESALVG